jgi:hypothetical protein
MRTAAGRLRLIAPRCVTPLACMTQLRDALLVGTRDFRLTRIGTRANI